MIEYIHTIIYIYNYKCGSKYLSDYIFILEKKYLPYLEFVEPSNEWTEKYHLNKIGNNLNIWLGLLKIADNKSLLAENEFENIDGDPNELSLFSCVVLANIHWIPSAKVLCIKNMHFGRDNGNNEKVENIKSFMSYFTVS